MTCSHLGLTDVFLCFEELLDLLGRIDEVRQGSVVVDSVDEESNELAEVDVCEPGSLEKLRTSVDEVCCKDLCDDAFFVSLVELVDAFREETESNGAEDSVSASLLHFACDVEDGVT